MRLRIEKENNEYLDERVVKTIYETTKTDEPWQLLFCLTIPPLADQTHTNSLVPFLIYRSNEEGDDVQVYDEFAAQKGAYGLIQGKQFMKLCLV